MSSNTNQKQPWGPFDWIDFSPAVCKALKRAGWYPSRQISRKAQLKLLRSFRKEGFIPFRASFEILKSFGGLTLRARRHRLEWIRQTQFYPISLTPFYPLLNGYCYENIEDFDMDIIPEGMHLLPLGNIGDDTILCIDPSGSICCSFMDYVFRRFGHTFPEALDFLITGARPIEDYDEEKNIWRSYPEGSKTIS